MREIKSDVNGKDNKENDKNRTGDGKRKMTQERTPAMKERNKETLAKEMKEDERQRGHKKNEI